MFKNIFVCLLFINMVFCYNNLDVAPRNRQKFRHHNDRVDDSEVANIDVAGLIQDDDRIRDEPFEVADSRDDLSNNNFDSLGEENLEEYQDNEDYLNKDTDDDSIFNEKPRNDRNDRSVADTKTNEKESQHHDNFLTQDNYKNLQKKCAFKNMKIPFFSHEKRKTTTQSKKNRKRKLFNFNSKKLRSKMYKVSTSLSPTTLRSTETTLFKLSKRSYLERICPICKRKFIRRAPDNEQTNSIHNSRQYYYRKSLDSNDSVMNYNKLDKNADAEPAKARASANEVIGSRSFE